MIFLECLFGTIIFQARDSTALSNSLQFRERDMQISLALRPQTQIPIPREARRIRLKLLQAF